MEWRQALRRTSQGMANYATVQVYDRGRADTVDVTQMPTPQTCNQFGKALTHQPKVRVIKKTKKAAINLQFICIAIMSLTVMS